MKLEESLGTGDPKYPKMIWPSKQLCPSCYLGRKIKWNNDEVFKFLMNYYGKTLVSVSKEKELTSGVNKSAGAEDLVATTNAVAVPAGAALAILVASCAFAGLAWCWRSRQKNRKYKYQLHSFKNIWLSDKYYNYHIPHRKEEKKKKLEGWFFPYFSFLFFCIFYTNISGKEEAGIEHLVTMVARGWWQFGRESANRRGRLKMLPSKCCNSNNIVYYLY